MKPHYIWNIFISALTTIAIVEYNWSLWTWLLTFAFSVFEYDKSNKT